MSALVGEYLPPLVTQLKGDNSDLLAAAAEAEAAMKAFGRTTGKTGDQVGSSTRKMGKDVDEFTDLVVRRSRKGEDAVSVLRRELKRTGDEVETLRKRLAKDTANQGLFADFRRATSDLERLRKLAKEIAPDLLDAGRKGGKGFVGGFLEFFSSIGEVAIPLIVAAVVASSPIIAGLIGSAVAVGLGLGFAGVGALAGALLLPKIRSQFIAMGREAKNSLLYGITGAFDEALRSGLLIFRVYVRQWKKPLRELFDALAPQLKFLFDALGGGIGEILTGLVTAVKQISGPGGPLETFIATIPMVFQAVGDFLTKITADGPALSRFIHDAANAIAGFLEGAGDVIGWLEGVYLWVVKLNDKLPFIGWANTVKWLGITVKAIGGWFSDLWAKIVTAAKAVGSWFADLGRSIWAWLKSAGSAIAGWFTTTVAWFRALPGKIATWLSALPGRIRDWFSRAAHQAAYFAGYLVGRVVRFFADLPGRIRTWVLAAWTFVTTKFREGVTASIEFVRALPGKIAEYFSYVWSAASSWAKRTWSSVVDWFRRTRDGMILWVARAITSVVEWFRGLPGKAVEQGKAFKDKVLGFFKSAKDWLYEAGKDIVRGLVDGIKDMWDWAVGKLKSFGHDLKKGFDDAIGRHSPAKAFIASGVDSALGYVIGIRKGMPQIQAMWRQMMDGMPAPAYAGGGMTPAMAQTFTTSAAASGGGSSAPVDNRIYVDGKLLIRTMTQPAQRRKARSGQSGLG